MRKIRSLSELNDSIDEDLGRRKRALTTTKIAVERAKDSTLRPLSLAAVCLLYAHFEGFIKHAGTTYLNYVHHMGVPLKDLSDGLTATFLRSQLKGLRDTKKVSLHRDVVTTVRSSSEKPSRIPYSAAIETYDNLNYEVLSEVLCIVGCRSVWYESKRAKIDEKLLKHRNSIAHTGEDADFDESEYSTLHSDTIELIERFRDDVQNCAASKAFLLTS